MLIYCICTQYLVGAPFALITASIRRGMEVISLWHCWGCICFSFSSWQYPTDSVWGSGDVGFQKTQWTNTSRWHCTPNHHRLWKLNTGLQATWAMSFSTLPPDSRTLVSKWNTKLVLIWKEDFGPLGNSPVLLLLLSPGKTSLTTTVAEFLDTSVCGALDALTPVSVHSLWSSPKFLNWFCLTILIRLRFSRLVVHLFLLHFFLPLNFLLTCLDTALCEQLLWQWMFVSYPPCEGCQWLSSGQLSDQQSSPWLCSLVNQTERPFWRLRKHLQVFWVDYLIGMSPYSNLLRWWIGFL